MEGQADRTPIAEELAELRAAINGLTEHVRVLIEAVDALTEEIQWRNNQLRDRYAALPVTQVTSMPLDPTTSDWKLNQLRPEDLPHETPVLAPQAQRATLFD